ncbi:MAG: DUF2911 domain-containing protein [Myxococcota bacterium]
MLLAAPAHAEDLQLPVLSPRATVSQQVGVATITVDYSSPGKRERTVWGELVPYGEVWRTGANTATTFETTADLTVGGTAVPAGTYSIFTVPGESEWTFILNKNAEQAGTGDYDKGLDQVRLKVAPEKGQERERLTFLFSDTTDHDTRLDLVWAGVRVSVPVEVDTAKAVNASIDRYVDDVSGGLASAARYKADNKDLDGALKLLDASIAIEKTWYNTWLKADALHQKGDNKAAYKLAQEANELGKAAGDGFFWKDRVEKALAEWKKR